MNFPATKDCTPGIHAHSMRREDEAWNMRIAENTMLLLVRNSAEIHRRLDTRSVHAWELNGHTLFARLPSTHIQWKTKELPG